MVQDDENYAFMNNSYTRWCRLKVENEMARCCTVADFAKGRGEGCQGCEAVCDHSRFKELCSRYWGRACNAKRKPFIKTGAGDFVVVETFCVPSDCDNLADQTALMPWYSITYRALRNGWHKDWDDATLDCPSDLGTWAMIVGGVIIGFILALPILWILFKVPKEPGKARTLVSQSDMQDDDASDAGDLRAAAVGDGTLGSSTSY